MYNNELFIRYEKPIIKINFNSLLNKYKNRSKFLVKELEYIKRLVGHLVALPT